MDSRDRQKINNNNIKVLLLCILSCVGVISSFQFIPLYLVPQIYATDTPMTAAAANQSSAVNNRTHTIMSAQGLSISRSAATPFKVLPCIGGLPCGIWRGIFNGLPGMLMIQSVDNQGKINASLLGDALSNGSWDPISKKITFTQTIHGGSNNSISYEYSGFYHNICGFSGEAARAISCFVLSGSAIPKGLPSEQAAKQEFGWIVFLEGSLLGSK